MTRSAVRSRTSPGRLVTKGWGIALLAVLFGGSSLLSANPAMAAKKKKGGPATQATDEASPPENNEKKDEKPAEPEKKAHAPSKYQQKVYDWVTAKASAPKASLIVNALAGSGKTTTMINAMRRIPKDQSVVFVAFNKHIADELETKTAEAKKKAAEAKAAGKPAEELPDVLPSTLSSFGWAACRKAYKWNKADIVDHCQKNGYPIPTFDKYYGGPILDDKKIPNIIDKVLTNAEDHEKYADTIADLIRLKKQYYSEDEKGKFNGPSAEEIANKHEIEIPTDPAEKQKFMAAATEVWKRSINDTKIMDFADMIFFPAKNKLPLANKNKGLGAEYKPDWCIVDETQDLSMTEATFVKRIAPRTVCVGDPHQSIYLFKGSDPQSMSKLQATLGAEELPLSICYRCPKSVIAEAQKIVPGIEAAPGAKDGTVETVKHNAIPSLAKPGSYVLCRTTAPLVQECLRMIAQGKKAHVKGKDIGKSVEKLIEKVTGKKNKGSMPIADFYKKLEEFRDAEMKRLTAAKKENLIDGLEDKIATIHALAAGAKTSGDITKKVNDIFTQEKSPGVTFCTVHKSKGLEADHIFIMRPDLMPFPKATTPEQLQQEMNLKYVAITRAKDRLTWVEPPPKEEKQESEWEGLYRQIVNPSVEQSDFPSKYQSVASGSNRTGIGTAPPEIGKPLATKTTPVKGIKAPVMPAVMRPRKGG